MKRLLKLLWSTGLKIGYNPAIPGLEKSRIMLLNGVIIVSCCSVVVFSICYAFIGYGYFYGPLYFLPVATTVLILNHIGKYNASRSLYLMGSLLVISYWCYEGRGNGNEYTLIGLATTTTLIFQRKATLYLINILCATIFIIYKIWHSSIPFIPDPTLNYNIVPWVILINSVAIVSFQMAFFRDLVQHYDDKLLLKYRELNLLHDQQKIIEEELITSNEALKTSNEKLQDLTSQLEVMVKRKNTELQSYIEAINVNLYSSIVDLNGFFIMVNEPMLTVSGYAREELIGINYAILDTLERTTDSFLNRSETLLAGETWIGEVKNRKKDGGIFWYDCVVIPIRDEGEAIKCFLSLGLPITERKLNAEMRERTKGVLETIAFRTSHKIRGPLARIEGLTNLIQKELIMTGEFKAIAEKLSVCSEELKMATSELVRFVNDHQESIKVQE